MGAEPNFGLDDSERVGIVQHGSGSLGKRLAERLEPWTFGPRDHFSPPRRVWFTSVTRDKRRFHPIFIGVKRCHGCPKWHALNRDIGWSHGSRGRTRTRLRLTMARQARKEKGGTHPSRGKYLYQCTKPMKTGVFERSTRTGTCTARHDLYQAAGSSAE